MAVSFKPIQPLFVTGTSAASRLMSYAGLGIGVLLLFCSVQMYINIEQLLGGNTIRKNGYDYVSITKTITNETMGKPEKNLFTQSEIEELKKQPFIENVSPLISNQFRVQLSAGAIVAFKTDLFLESIDNDFLDTIPPNFQWQEGQMHIPVVLSSDFLEAYNVFAPGQGLPQISQSTATNIPFEIGCSGNGRNASFSANVTGFSDRINSVLVPKRFLDWANKTFGDNSNVLPSRVFIKTKDANNTDLIKFIDSRNYKINKDKTKFGRTKQVIQGIFTGLGIFGLFVVLMALMLFSFYLQLIIARSRDNIQLLLLLGYSPEWLGKNISKRFIPVYISIILIALVITQIIQWAFHHFIMYDRPELDTMINWIVLLLGIMLMFLATFANYTFVRNKLSRLKF
ncbi:MAG: FtsX-like permease family protein [Flavisolibacter sp.]